MNSLVENKTRLSIFVLFCEKNEVRKYVVDYLNNLLKISTKVVVVVNGSISSQSLQKLNDIGVVVKVRENHGLDFGAWQDCIEDLGWQNILHYDELVLCNSSCYCLSKGFDESFRKMRSSKCDFWGMTQHAENKNKGIIEK